MNAPNDSVIICDSPSSSTTTEWAATSNYRKRLRSHSEIKTLLGTYESPLAHLKRIVPNDTINVADNDVTVVSTPPAKRYKKNVESKTSKEGLASARLDQSVMILNNTSPEPIIDLDVADTRTDDIGEVNETSQSVVPSMKKTSRNVSESPIKNCRTPKPCRYLLNKNKEKQKNKKTARAAIECLTNNDENHNGQIMGESTTGQSEDIQVVWVSGPNMESTTSNTTASVDQPIVIDKQRYLGNLVQSVPLYTKKSKDKTRTKRLIRQTKNLRSRDKCTDSKTANQQCSRISRVPVNEENARLREIVIDGCNIAYGHTNGREFSEKGIQIVINYFRDRNHVVTAFLPQSVRSRERKLLERLHKQGNVVFTPSRKIGGRDITPYDDRFILEYATKCNGIVVSSDQYRDLWQEKPQWRDTIENRLLAPTFVGDYLMFPEDPLGRRGPKLKEFLCY